MTSYLRAVARTALSVSWLLIAFFPLLFTSLIGATRANCAITMFSFRVGTWIWGIRVKTEGSLAANRPLLVAANHFSYLDVFALGSVIPARHTPKSEIASWPGIGFMCKITNCIFIDRRPSQTLRNKRALDRAVHHADIICLFPEGTTNDGTRLLPFKSAFFSIAEKMDITVQPVSVVYTKLNGKPMDDAARPVVGWYGDAEFAPHALYFLRQHTVEVTLVFHAPVSGKNFASRKAIASYCEGAIAKSLFPNHTDKKSAPE